MSIILKRPMFRTGGTVNRQNFQTGANSLFNFLMSSAVDSDENKAVEEKKDTRSIDMTRQAAAKAYSDQIYKQVAPTYREQILDFLTAFGASGAPPGEYQDIGSSIAKTSKLFGETFNPKEQAARKLSTQAYIAGLKGVSPEKLLEYQKMANDLVKSGQFKNYEEAVNYVIKRQLEGKTPDPKAKILEVIRDKNKRTYNETEVDAEANLQVEINRNPKLRREIGPLYVSVIPRDLFNKAPDGSFELSPTVNNEVKKKFKPGEIYLDAFTDDLYYVTKDPNTQKIKLIFRQNFRNYK